MDARRRAAALTLLALAAWGCRSAREERPREPDPPPEGATVEQLGEPSEVAEEAPPAIADAPPPPLPDQVPQRTIERAQAPDDEYASDDAVEARRYVYRVRLLVPETLGEERSDLAIPAAELFVDVSHERLRARFVGPGWPVEAGSEVRLRDDSAGVYVIDREGGRSLPPGALAEWFEGGPPRIGPALVVRRDTTVRRDRDAPIPPGALVCALLAEWTGEQRDGVMRRCDRGAPSAFRVGLWRAERTADVPVELPRSSLRADEVGPPPPIGRSASRAFLEPAALSRIPIPERVEPPEPSARPDDAPPPGEGLEVVNGSEARVVVTVEGIAVGWVDPGASGLFVGLRPGLYRVAALRPLGAVVIRPRVVDVPARTTIRASRRAP